MFPRNLIFRNVLLAPEWDQKNLYIKRRTSYNKINLGKRRWVIMIMGAAEIQMHIKNETEIPLIKGHLKFFRNKSY